MARRRISELQDDDVAAVELPLRLLVVLVVAGVAFPTVFAILMSYSVIQTERNVIDGIETVFSAVQQVYQAANGTSLVVNVNFRAGLVNRVESIRIGDSLGTANATVARYKMMDAPIRYVAVPGDLRISMTTFSNRSLVLGAGNYVLIVQHWKLGDRFFVVVDLEGGRMNVGCFEPRPSNC